MKLWLDDLRQPQDDSWLWAKDYAEAVRIMKNNQIIIAALDHDLGDGPSGFDFVKWMLVNVRDIPQEVYLMSNNPVGRKAQALALQDAGYIYIGSGDIGMYRNCDAYVLEDHGQE